MFNYDSSSGNTGTLSLLNAYIFTDPVSVTSQNVFFNVTGKTANATALPSYQLQFQAWGTAGTGIVPVVVESGSVRPTYILNAGSYSYVNPNITAYTQNANSTVTVSFESFAGNYLYSATAPITAASWDGASRTFSFTASSGTFLLYTPFTAVTEVRKNGVIIAGDTEWTWDSVAHLITVTSTSTGSWEIVFYGGDIGGPVTTSTSSTTTSSGVWTTTFANPVYPYLPNMNLQLHPYQKFTLHENTGEQINLILDARVQGDPLTLTLIEFSVPWMQVSNQSAFPKTYPIGTTQIQIPVTVTTPTFQLNGTSSINATLYAHFVWYTGTISTIQSGTSENSGSFQAIILPQSTLQMPTNLTNILLLAGAGIIGIVIYRKYKNGKKLEGF